MRMTEEYPVPGPLCGLRRTNATAPRLITGAPEFQSPCGRSATVAEEAQQEQEQVDEVEIERERAHHRLAADDGAVFHRVIHFLDPLGVPSGQAREDQHAGGRDHEVEPGALEEKID